VTRYYEFDERLRLSGESAVDAAVTTIIRTSLPGVTHVERAGEFSDRNGTDYWARREYQPGLSVDLKLRTEDWSLRGRDDVALETWSVVGQKTGWSRDETKQTDWVLWYWQDTRRYLLFPFPALCSVFTRNAADWLARYKHAPQSSGSWESECVFVPRRELMVAYSGWMNGRLST
jgi:hypothetical protein